jgi:hypothetical protein
MKQEWGREMCIDQCNFNDRMELAWLRLGKWRLRCERRDVPYVMQLRMWLICY